MHIAHARTDEIDSNNKVRWRWRHEKRNKHQGLICCPLLLLLLLLCFLFLVLSVVPQLVRDGKFRAAAS